MCATRDKQTNPKKGTRRTSESRHPRTPSALHLHPSQTTVTESLYKRATTLSALRKDENLDRFEFFRILSRGFFTNRLSDTLITMVCFDRFRSDGNSFFQVLRAARRRRRSRCDRKPSSARAADRVPGRIDGSHEGTHRPRRATGTATSCGSTAVSLDDAWRSTEPGRTLPAESPRPSHEGR
jgi:hypothetical protein